MYKLFKLENLNLYEPANNWLHYATKLAPKQVSIQPISRPTSQLAGQPTRQPTNQLTGQPTRQPTSQPTSQSISQPIEQRLEYFR